MLIVIHTAAGEFLLLERRRPPGFWQSVTGSLEWGERADQAARREVIEETGITQGVLVNLQWTQVYEILPAFGKVYAPGITRNLEHAFSLRLARRATVALSDSEHVQYRWVPAAEAIEKMDGRELGGRSIRVTKSADRQDRGAPGAVGGGGGGGGYRTPNRPGGPKKSRPKGSRRNLRGKKRSL